MYQHPCIAFQEKDENASSDEEAHFSLITGQYKTGPFHRAGGAAKDGKYNTNDQKRRLIFFEIKIDSGEVLTSTLTDLTLRNKETSISMLLNSTAGKKKRL